MPYKTPDKQREYQRQRVSQCRADYFADKVCAKCGSVERLELDHIDPSTKVSHNIWSWSQTRREAEIAKCQVLCYDCHKKKTAIDVQNWWTEQPNQAVCGTHSCYASGCRCSSCKRAHAAYNRQCRSQQNYGAGGRSVSRGGS